MVTPHRIGGPGPLAQFIVGTFIVLACLLFLSLIFLFVASLPSLLFPV